MTLKVGHVTIEELEANDVRVATLQGAAKDVKDFMHDLAVIQHSDATNGATVTLDGKIQDSDDGTTGWADVAGAVFAQVDNTAGGSFQTIIIKADAVKRYIRYVGTIAGTSPSFAFGVATAGLKQSR